MNCTRANVPPTTVARVGGQGLGDAGWSFEQHVATGEQRHHEALDEAVLTDDDLAHLEQGVLEQRGVVGAGAGIGHGVDRTDALAPVDGGRPRA